MFSPPIRCSVCSVGFWCNVPEWRHGYSCGWNCVSGGMTGVAARDCAGMVPVRNGASEIIVSILKWF